VYGPGGSGKSTFLEAVRATLGDYATTARFDMFVKRVGDAPSANPDEARLRGSRFVASIETDEGKRLSEGTIKRLTGGDVISARELYSRAFDYKPAFKLWLAANDAPRVNDQDDALFRRMRRIVFPHGRTGEGTRDKSIKAMLTNASATGPAILAWAVQGCLAWQRDGLKTPAAVVASTNAYRAENDPLAEFFSARIAFDPRATVARKSIRAAYEAWVRDCGSGDPMSPKRFAERLRARLVAEHGAAHKADASVRLGPSVVDGWRGMRLSDPHAAEDTAAPARRHEPDDAPGDAPRDGWVA
jgi:putative DNA primase/helicase